MPFSADVRLRAAIAAGRLTSSLIRLFRAGGATTVPGRVARALDPEILARLGGRLPLGTVLISGTNGKTTTSRLLTAILRAAGVSAIHNRAGANLPAGITAALLARATLGSAVRGEIGVFEVDEASLPLVAGPLRPRVVVLGNLFRDQLDRYGEIDLVADRWRAALHDLPRSAVVLYNADDPLVADVGRTWPSARTFGIEDRAIRRHQQLEHAADARYCYRCGRPYRYDAVYLGHQGIYVCDSCGTARPPVDLSAQRVRLRGMEGSAFDLVTRAMECRVPPVTGSGSEVPLRTVLPGLYNVYNVLAAAGAAVALEVPLETVRRAVEGFVPAFGRGERVAIDGHPLYLLLAKNPAGFNEVLRTVLAEDRPITAVIAINDLTADGHDISWLWDVDFEMLRDRARALVVTGIRAEDMAARLKYAGVDGSIVTVEHDGARALRAGLARLSGTDPLYVLPTYTAMLRLREILARQGHVRAFWED